MITIKIKRINDNIVFFSAEGHAEYASDGEDIICAAVSAILQTAAFGLIDYLELKPEINTSDGWLSCQLDQEQAQDKEVQAILGAMVAGLKATVKEYSEYIEINEGGGNNV
ncbi:MAG: ribosomal-processing cysteine protease Prp [Bacillota bacterium]